MKSKAKVFEIGRPPWVYGDYRIGKRLAGNTNEYGALLSACDEMFSAITGIHLKPGTKAKFMLVRVVEKKKGRKK